MIQPAFVTTLMLHPHRGLVAPYVMFPKDSGPLICEIYYNPGDCRFREVIFGLPDGVNEVNPEDIKDEKS